MAIPITEIKGIGLKTAILLAEHGYSSAEELAAAQPHDLVAISGFGAVRAGLVIEAARTLTSETVDTPAPEQVPQPIAEFNLEIEVQKQESDQSKKKSTKKKGKTTKTKSKIKKKKEEKSKKEQDKVKKKKKKKKKK